LRTGARPASSGSASRSAIHQAAWR
jgi:hypothetical protein